MKPLTYLSLLCVLLLGLYALVASPLSTYLSVNYTSKLNAERLTHGLQPIHPNWTLDSTVFEGHGDYSIEEARATPIWQLWLQSEQLMCGYWSAPDAEKGNYKKLYYTKSFWFWKNKPKAEIDIYTHKLGALRQAQLSLGYFFATQESFARIDTLISQVKIDSAVAYAKQWEYMLCGLPLLELNRTWETRVLDYTEAQAILSRWENPPAPSCFKEFIALEDITKITVHNNNGRTELSSTQLEKLKGALGNMSLYFCCPTKPGAILLEIEIAGNTYTAYSSTGSELLVFPRTLPYRNVQHLPEGPEVYFEMPVEMNLNNYP